MSCAHPSVPRRQPPGLQNGVKNRACPAGPCAGGVQTSQVPGASSSEGFSGHILRATPQSVSPCSPLLAFQEG